MNKDNKELEREKYMIPKIVKETINLLKKALHKRNIEVEGIYLYGSVALGAFIEGSSDIDFIAILKEEPCTQDRDLILEAHKEVEVILPDTDIMGAYILKSEIGMLEDERSFLLTYFNKELHTNGFGSDLNPVTWWMVTNRGIHVYGSAQLIDFKIEMDHVLPYVINNLNTYWKGTVEKLKQQLAFIEAVAHEESVTKQLDEAVEWCSLGMLRQLYTLKEKDITSKIGAGLYGLDVLPEKFHELIQEAISIKKRQPIRHYNDNKQRLTDLVELLTFIEAEANVAFNTQNGVQA